MAKSAGELLLEQIVEVHGEEEELLQADGLVDALIGIDEKSEPMRLIYSVTKIIKALQEQGMTEEEAIEFYGYNIEGAYVGLATPIWCHDDY